VKTQTSSKLRPPVPLHEVTLAASGRKAGANKKDAASWVSRKTRSTLCKASVFEQVRGIVLRVASVAALRQPEEQEPIAPLLLPPSLTYREAKKLLGAGA